jgi:hypothetical protein
MGGACGARPRRVVKGAKDLERRTQTPVTNTAFRSPVGRISNEPAERWSHAALLIDGTS